MEWELTGHLVYLTAMLLLGLGAAFVFTDSDTALYIGVTAVGRWKAYLRYMKQLTSEQKQLAQILGSRINQIRSRRYESEIYDSSLFLKNMALADRSRSFSADYIYERLMEYSRKMKPVYAHMLMLYRAGRDEEAFAYLAEQCGSRNGKNFSLILSKLDRIAPDELAEQMEVFQEIMEQERVTAEMKRVQHNSLMTTLLATVSVFVMVLDFAVVIVFMHTLSMMENIF